MTRTPEISEIMRGLVGGLFYYDWLESELNYDDALIEALDGANEYVLEQYIEFCNIALDNKLSPTDLKRLWRDVTQDEPPFTHEGTVTILNFVRKEAHARLVNLAKA